MALALVVIAGIFAYQHVTSNSPTAKQGAGVQNPSTASKPKVSNSPAAAHHPRHHLHIRLTAVQNCWVQVIARSGATLFSGMVYAGNTMYWNERHPVRLVLGNPSGVRVLVNGKNAIPRGSVSMLTLTLRAGTAHKHA
jgi:hypothetical protein